MTTNRPADLAPDWADPLDLNMTPTKSAARTCRFLWDTRVDLEAARQNLATAQGSLAREGSIWCVGDAADDARAITAAIADVTARIDQVNALYAKWDRLRKVRATIAERGVA